jgi:hypothetical protein
MGLLFVPVLAPAIGALVVAMLPDTPGSRRTARWCAIVSFEAAVGVGAASLARALRDEPFGRLGFVGDPWRIALVLGILLISAALLVGRDRAPRETAIVLVITSAAAAMPLAYHAVSAAAFLVVSGLGVAALARLRASGSGALAAAWFGAAHVMVIAGLVLQHADGASLPFIARGAGAALSIAGVAILGGLVPATALVAEHDAVIGAVALGPMRAQALAVAVWVGLGRGGPAAGLAIGGAVAAMWFARTASRNASAAAALASVTGLVVAAIGMGTAASRQGAGLLVGGLFVGSMLFVLGRTDAGSPSIGAAPLGATLPGAVVVATALLDRALVERLMFAAAVPATLALVWLAHAGVAGFRARAGAHVGWSAAPLLAGAALAFAPASVIGGFAAPASSAIGSPRILGDVPGVMSNVLGLVFALAAAAAVVALRAGAPLTAEPDPIPPPPRGRAQLVAFAFCAVAFGWFLALLWVGMRRGFL